MLYLLELSKRNMDLKISVDGFDQRESLFMLIVMLFAINAKRLRYDGNIQSDAVSVAYVLKYNLDGYVIKNGEKVSILDLYKKYHSDQFYLYHIQKTPTKRTIQQLIEDDHLDNNESDPSSFDDKIISERKKLVDQLPESEQGKPVNLIIPGEITLDTIADTYLQNSGLDGVYDELFELRESSKNFDDYQCYDELIKAIAISKINKELFNLSSLEWIETDNFIAWNEVTDIEIKKMIYELYETDRNKICISHGYPEYSLTNKTSIDVLGNDYCIDEYTIKENVDISNIKIYINWKIKQKIF